MELPKAKKRKRALLVEGGGMKGAFAGGVLHSLNCILPAKNFDLVLAVSSGACCAAYYATTPDPEPVSGDHTLSIWKYELAGKKLISIFHPLFGKPFLDQKYLIDYLFRKKYRILTENLGKKGLPELRIAVSNLRSRSVEYRKATKENLFDLLKAATSLPIATKGKYKVEGEYLSDAAILNPLPLQDLIQAGYKDITVVLNSPIQHSSPPLTSISRFLSFPLDRKLSKIMKFSHHTNYNTAREIASNPPKGVRIYTIAPESKLPVGLITTKQSRLEETVELGKEIGRKAAKFLKRKL
ncbi:patatin-like phospholipase family protein [Leptospira licerasiae]|uniref:Phospholipase, patatin family n=1 Tax=Leptospira licerasiae str. MMD4847 TaxID=1049971 RepID=A0ABP2RCH9_9LEPT|nr:patatin-like phospholipase family protein [Leptospira licerasiae]EIE03238.1 phospholipase, patatin family [Leptospira licerasiae serovar Varillal str. VAR 010]EJZ40559.1 phospholipase, patatin family [Leptospira licerasiae str. MMD4847]